MPETKLIRSRTCGVTNRVPMDRVAGGEKPVGGRCTTPIVVGTKPLIVTHGTFAAEVENSPSPVVLDMWAAWCGPCQRIAPMFEERAQQMGDRVRFAKLNVDENPVTAARFDVRNIPTLRVFKGGREVDRIVGLLPRSESARRLERLTV